MNIGMLWFDNDTKDALDARIERAARYYQNKYGKKPTLCFMHPSMVPEVKDEVIRRGGVEVRTTRSVLPNHFWIGVNGVEKISPTGS